MSEIRVKTMSRDMLSMQLHDALKDIKDGKERKVVVSLLVAQLILLERLQQMRYVLRAAFWKCNYHIFDYLRIQGQVGREDGDFDAGVKIFLKELLDGLCCPEPTEHHDSN